MQHVPSYSTIFALGHRSISGLLSGPVVIEEKIDGSQFAMSVDAEGHVSCRSKGQDLDTLNPEKMFSLAVESARSLRLHSGWIYRCEYLRSPKHNTLAYARIPKKHLIVYDIETAPNVFLSPLDKMLEAQRIGLDCVPCYFQGIFTNEKDANISRFLDIESILGGCKVEGVVIKNYEQLTPDKKVAMAKIVCAGFKEKNQGKDSGKSGATKADVVQVLSAALRTEARWAKAMQRLRDAGALTGTPKDIGAIMKSAHEDIVKEEGEWIASELLKHALPQILRGATLGLPDWFKAQLAATAFDAASTAGEELALAS